MGDQATADPSTMQRGGAQSLAELFHLVKTLIPEGQRVLTVPPTTTVAEAVQKMREYNYSQLPVVAGNQVLGVFSFRSLATGVLKMGSITQAVSIGGLPVAEFMEHLDFAQLSDQWERILPLLDRDNAVLVGQREELQGILTPMDVLNYLHKITSPFVMIAEIELSLRRIIRACLNDEDLAACAQSALASKYGLSSESPAELPETILDDYVQSLKACASDEELKAHVQEILASKHERRLPTNLTEMTFNDYVSIITDKNNWERFAGVFFGEGDRAAWTRKNVSERLLQVRNLRNRVFHFRSSLSDEELQALREHRDWLQIRTSALEATRAVSLPEATKVTPPSPGKPPSSQRGKWDEPSFFAELGKKRGPQAVAAARRILAWAREKGTRVTWGTGRYTGSFGVTLIHRGKGHGLFFVMTNGELATWFSSYKFPFDSEAKKLELLQRLNDIGGITLCNVATGYLSISPDTLENQAALQQILGVFEWVIEEIRKT